MLKSVNVEIVPELQYIQATKRYLAVMSFGTSRISGEGESPAEAVEAFKEQVEYYYGTKSPINVQIRAKNESIMDEWVKANPIPTANHNPNHGHLHLCSISGLKNVNIHEYSKRLFAVRSAKDDILQGIAKYNFTQVPQLSPSARLFSDYYRWRKGEFTDEELEKIYDSGVPEGAPIEDMWWALYVPRFYNELAQRPDLIKNMKRIIELLEQGENVLLMCYCPQLQYCHRKIIGIEIAKRGFKVIFE